MTAPEIKEKTEGKKPLAKVESKPYVPVEAKPAPKEELPDIDKVYEDRKESKEKEKIPELKPNNYKHWSPLTKQQKENMKVGETLGGWTKEEMIAGIDGVGKKIVVLKEEIDGKYPDAFVWEYTNDGVIPAHLVGEQLFNWNAVLNLGLRDMLPKWEDMQAMGGKTKENYEKFLKNNFQKDGKNLFPGHWDPRDEEFGSIGIRTACWLSDADGVGLTEDNMGRTYSDPGFGFSLRLLKN